MEPYTLTTASEAARKSKSTILRAIQKGRLSATRTDNGGWLIDPAELHRAFPGVLHGMNATAVTSSQNVLQAKGGMAALQARLEATEARLADTQELVGTLWRRLDRAEEERRQVQAQRAGLVTDQRPAQRRWWVSGALLPSCGR